MILPDLNLLIYAYDQRSPFHVAALGWWEEALSGSQLIGLPWQVSLGFVRLTTSPRNFSQPLSVAQACDVVAQWYRVSNVRVLEPGPGHLAVLQECLQGAGMAGPLVSDAHLAALAIENRATLYSHDQDFRRFPGLRFKDPL